MVFLALFFFGGGYLCFVFCFRFFLFWGVFCTIIYAKQPKSFRNKSISLFLSIVLF